MGRSCCVVVAYRMACREQETQEVCSVCGELTKECCLRCSTPFCEEHQPSSDERCSDCESQYLPVAQKHAKELQKLRGWSKPIRLCAAAALGAFGLYILVSGMGMSLLGALLVLSLIHI